MVLAVGKDHAPHHADDLDPVLHLQLGQPAGELIEIHRFGVAGRGFLDQLVDVGLIEIIVIHQRATDGLALLFLHAAIDAGQMHQQGRHGQARIAGVELGFGLSEQARQGLEHRRVSIEIGTRIGWETPETGW